MDDNNFIDSANIQVDIKQIWESAKNFVSTQVSGVSYDVWIDTLEAVDLKGNTLVLSTPSASSQNVLKQRYKTKVAAACNKAHSAITDVEFIVESQSDETLKEESENTSETVTIEKKPTLTSSTFNQKFTFDNFVIGSSNQFVAAAAKAVAERPGTNCNPLFIWGGVGLGKTHLLHAIGNYITENKKNMNVVYVTTEKFTNKLPPVKLIQ